MKRIIALVIVLTASIVCFTAFSESSDKYIICNPESYVLVRKSPKNTAEATGRLDCGDTIQTDGKQKDGFLHILGVTEFGEGWVFQGYIVDDEPMIEQGKATVTANGRVAARKYIGSKEYKWVKVCTDVKLLARSEEWAVTDKGFIKTEYLELWYE